MSDPAQFFASMQVAISSMSANTGGGGEVLYGALDMASGVLMIDVAQTIKPGVKPRRYKDSAMATDDATADDYDILFTEDLLQDAIRDYFSFAGRGVLDIGDAVQRHNPTSKIEADGLDEHGRKFRLSPDITNGQIAVIVMCWFALKQDGYAKQIAAFDEQVDPIVRSVGIPEAPSRKIAGYAMGGKLALGVDGWPV